MAEDKLEIEIVDEQGNIITKEDAMREEEELNNMLDKYFKATPPTPPRTIEQEQEDVKDKYSSIVSLNQNGEVLKDVLKETKEEVKEVLIPQETESFIEQELYRFIVEKRVSDLKKGRRYINDLYKEFNSFIRGDAMVDNLLRTLHDELNPLQSLLFKEKIDFSELEDKRLEKKLNDDSKKLLRSMFEQAFEEKEDKEGNA